MKPRKAGWIAVAVGLGLASLAHSPNELPLYDGLPVPSPYRYVSPPPDLGPSNQRPLPGEATLSVENGQVSGGGAQTGDDQVLVFFGLGALRASSRATSVTIRIDPVTDPPPAPRGSQIRGNVYRISGTEQPGGAPVTVVHGFNVTMQYPLGPLRELQFYDGSSWHALRTQVDITSRYVRATPTAFGEIAATAEPSGFLNALLGMIASYGLLAFLVVFGGIAVWHEVRRRRRSRDSGRMGGGEAR